MKIIFVFFIGLLFNQMNLLNAATLPRSQINSQTIEDREALVQRSKSMRESNNFMNESNDHSMRAKQLRKALIRQQIENALNIRGKNMPSVNEVLTPKEIESTVQIWNNIGANDSINMKNSNHNFSSSWFNNKTDNNSKILKNQSQGLNSSNGSHFKAYGKIDDFMLDLILENANHQDQEQHLFSDYTEKMKSMFPECAIPRKATRLIRPTNKDIHLYFHIKHEKPELGYKINFLQGNLNLYFEDLAKNNNDNETFLKISVSWIRNLKHKDSQDLDILDSKIVKNTTEKWISFNVLSSLEKWLKKPHNNFGFLITVHDANDNKLSATDYFKPMNCEFQADHDVVLPSILTESVDAESLSNETENNDILFNLLNHEKNPTLDITTVEIPIEKQKLFNKIFQRNGKYSSKKSSSPINVVSSPKGQEFEFPEFDFTHVKHKIPINEFSNSIKTSTTSSTTTTTTSKPLPEINFQELDIFEKFKNLHQQPMDSFPSSLDHTINFSPTNKKLVMTSKDFQNHINSKDNDEKKGSFLDFILKNNLKTD